MVETREHLFFDCVQTKQAMQIYNNLSGLQLSTQSSGDFTNDLKSIIYQLAHITPQTLHSIIFLRNSLWMARNNLIFRNKKSTPKEIAEHVFFQFTN